MKTFSLPQRRDFDVTAHTTHALIDEKIFPRRSSCSLRPTMHLTALACIDRRSKNGERRKVVSPQPFVSTIPRPFTPLEVLQ